MSNTDKFLASATGTALSATGTAMQPNDVLQTISIIITIAGGVVTLIFGILGLVDRIKKWHSKAMEDGKIDDDEKKELIGILKEGYDDAKQSVDNIKEATKKGKKNGLH